MSPHPGRQAEPALELPPRRLRVSPPASQNHLYPEPLLEKTNRQTTKQNTLGNENQRSWIGEKQVRCRAEVTSVIWKVKQKLQQQREGSGDKQERDMESVLKVSPGLSFHANISAGTQPVL